MTPTVSSDRMSVIVCDPDCRQSYKNKLYIKRTQLKDAFSVINMVHATVYQRANIFTVN